LEIILDKLDNIGENGFFLLRTVLNLTAKIEDTVDALVNIASFFCCVFSVLCSKL